MEDSVGKPPKVKIKSADMNLRAQMQEAAEFRDSEQDLREELLLSRSALARAAEDDAGREEILCNLFSALKECLPWAEEWANEHKEILSSRQLARLQRAREAISQARITS